MSIPGQDIRQRDFSAGEIDPDAERRDDSDVFKFGVRYARNLQSLRTGPLQRRAGRTWLYNDAGVRDEFRPFGDVIYSVTFGVSRAAIRGEDGSILQTLTAPWTTIDGLVWEFYDNQVFVCGPNLHPQVIEVDKVTRAWSIRDYAFELGLSGKVYAPFYRFVAKGATMRPSDVKGNVTVTFSAAVLLPGHVGTVFRYAGKQLRITGVTSPTAGTATVIEKLNPTMKFVLQSDVEIGGFTVGETASTSESGIVGEIVAIDVGLKAVTIVITNRYRFLTDQDRLVGPSADAAINVGSTTIVSPGATTQWDEIFMSDVRGWPQSVSTDTQRLIFCDFPQFKRAIVWSATAGPFNCLVAADSTGAIFEYLEADVRVYHVIGGYDEFAITDAGAFYIPISADNPLAPGSVEFRRIYAGELSQVRPVQVTEGVLFVDAARTGVYAITATGQVARPYVANEIGEFHRHLFNEIKFLAATSGTPQAAARQIFVVNGDGTVVIGQYNTEHGYVGWLKWDSAGGVRAVSARFGEVIFSSTYPVAAGVVDVAERIDYDRLLDCSISASGGAYADVLELSSGEPLLLANGTPIAFSGFVTSFLANATVQIMADGFYLGDVVVGPAGQINGFGQYTDVTIGFSFSWSLQPNIPAFEGGEAFGQRMRRRKISKAMIKVKDTTEFQCGNRLFAGYDGGDDRSLPMPLRNAVYRYREQGRSYDPNFQLQQTVPGPFKLIELSTEVTV